MPLSSRFLFILFVTTVPALAQGGGETPSGVPYSVRPGLDAMVRAETAKRLDLGSSAHAPGDADDRILFRIRPSLEAATVHGIRARVEGQWYALQGRRDASRTTLYQAYLEGPVPGSRTLSWKAGRQELVFGSAFMLGADGFHDGLSHDALRLTAKPSEWWSVDLFGGQYAKGDSGGIEGKMYGAYGTYAPLEGLSVDIYGLRDAGEDPSTREGGDPDVTYSAGARVAASLGRILSVEAEPVLQFGRKGRPGGGGDTVRAAGGHVDATVASPPEWIPARLFAGYAFGSGDGDPGDGRFRQFRNPDNDTGQIGDMGVIGDLGGVAAGEAFASGIRVVTAGVSVDPAPGLNITLDAHRFRAAHVPPGFRRDLGTEANLVVAYTVRDGLVLSLGASRFFTGGFFRDAAGDGKDMVHGYAQLCATF